ncbi:MAG: GHKL domain-containing protein [Oscillospiraceae bacterium]|nr:GHKL domain-containing protein [Oscillospiraceae bacterium]
MLGINFFMEVIGITFSIIIIGQCYAALMGKSVMAKRKFLILNGAVWAFWILCHTSPVKEYFLAFVSLVLFFLLSLPYPAKWYIKIALSIFLFMQCLFAEWISYSLLAIIMQLDALPLRTDEMVSGLAYLAILLTPNAAVLSIIKIITYKKAGSCSNISVKTFIVLPVMLFLTALFLLWLSVADGAAVKVASLIVVALALLIVLLWILLIVFSKKLAENEAVKRNLILREQQIEHYREMTRRQAEIRTLSHNMKNYMSGLLGLVQEGNLGEVSRCIDEIIGDIKQADSVFDTGHAALDAILNLKKQGMDSLGIRLDSFVTLPPGELSIDILELCIILGNGLDNAIEACAGLPQGRERYIRLAVNAHSKYISISIENPTAQTGESNEIPKTKKSDKFYHGLGLKSISSLAKKYDGTLNIRVADQIFTLAVMLKNE